MAWWPDVHLSFSDARHLAAMFFKRSFGKPKANLAALVQAAEGVQTYGDPSSSIEAVGGDPVNPELPHRAFFFLLFFSWRWPCAEGVSRRGHD